ncbi:MAG: hypothetical protein GC181_02520 [Bacteroidetes bacterium]|nr:hypothetical protein [Bacteroidota bacterium]
MSAIRPFFLFFLLLFFQPAQNCPGYLSRLFNGYIGLEPGVATKNELLELDLNNIRDTNNMAITKMSVVEMSVSTRKIGEAQYKYIST